MPRFLTMLALGASSAAAQMPTVSAVCHSNVLGADVPGIPRPIVTAETLLALRKLVRDRRFKTLDSTYAEYARAARLDVRNEGAWFATYQAVAIADPRLEQPLADWVKSTGSVPSRLARATYRNAKAWAARGEKLGSETSDSAFALTGRREFLSALDLDLVLQKEPDNLLALLLISDFARVQGADTVAKLVAGAAVRESPASWLARAQIMEALEPRWLGSYEAMDAFAASADSFARRYPQLRALHGFSTLDVGDSLERAKDETGALAKYDQGLRYGDSGMGRYYRGNLYYNTNRNGPAIADFNCAAAYAPWRADVLAMRGMARLSLAGDASDRLSRSFRQQGVADLQLAVALDSSDATVKWALKTRR